MIADQTWEEMRDRGEVAGIRTIFLDRTGSTSDEAMALFNKGATVPLLVVAEKQEQGRGRMGRSWFSPPGAGLYFTILVSPSLTPDTLPLLSLAAGVGCSRAINDASGVAVALKWPNDLIAHDRKLGGILCESAPLDKGRPTVAIGVGVNVNTPAEAIPAEIKKRAISLAGITGQEIPRGPLLAGLVRAIIAEVDTLAASGREILLEKWRKLDWTKGKVLTWRGIDGRTVHGTGAGITEEGLLLIRSSDGITTPVISGDVEP